MKQHLLAALIAVALPAHLPAQLMVTTAADEDNGNANITNGTGTSLREAVKYAAAGSTVTFTNTLSGAKIVLASGQIVVNKNLTIDASGLAKGIAIDGNRNSRIFEIVAGTTSRLANLTLTNGDAVSGGAILLNLSAALTIENCTLTGNRGIYGGGLRNYGGALTISNSTLTGGLASQGGGVYSHSDLILRTTVVNSTFHNNTAVSRGGAWYNYDGASDFFHCTFTGNTAPLGEGGGVAGYGDAMTETVVQNCILAGNINSDVDVVADVHNSFTSLGHNLIGMGNALANFNQPGDQTSAVAQLAPLGDYGGSTPTRPPLSGSPALDAGLITANTPDTDQRGFARVLNGLVDIGAVEGAYSPGGPRLTDLTKLGDGSVQFAFSNSSEISYSVIASTNITAPVNTWLNLGPGVESPPGVFIFTDIQATNYLQRFYRLQGP